MALLIGAALAVVSIVILVYPFLKARIRAQPKDPTGSASGNAPGLGAIYQEISTLRLEYQLGKVPEDAYREQMRAYRLQAAVALREQAQVGESALPEASPPTPSPSLMERGFGGEAAGVSARCPHCGAAVGREDGACPDCTASLAGSVGDAP